MAIVTMVDARNGWKYGFPRVVPKLRREDALEWMIENGYPREETKSQDFYMKMWMQEENVDEQRL